MKVISRKWWGLLAVALALTCINRPNEFFPIWAKAIAWQLTNPKIYSLGGAELNIHWGWWIASRDSRSISFLRAPMWNKPTMGLVTLSITESDGIELDSLLTLDSLGGDSVITAESMELPISGKIFRGTRLTLQDSQKRLLPTNRIH